MATTKIWAVHSRLDHLMDYVSNKEKTNNIEYDLNTVLEYAKEDLKTEKKYYVSGINCNPETAITSMMNSHKKNTKDLKVLAYHGYQSFAEGEVTAESAHNIGLELAMQLWGDRFQVVVATHLNTNHYHNHFVLCSTSFLDGKRFHACTESYMKMRSMSDKLCKENSLSVIKNPQRGNTKHYAEIKSEREGKITWRGNIRDDIDKAILQATTTKHFWDAMEQMGYELKMNVKYPGVKPPGHSKFFRLYKLGDNYTQEAIKSRIIKNISRAYPFSEKEKKTRTYHFKGVFKKHKKVNGLRALYIYYQYMLGIIPGGLRNKNYQTSASNKRMHFLLREDLIKLDSLIAQCSLLCEKKINTHEQLALYKYSVEEKIQTFVATRLDLRNQMKCSMRNNTDANPIEIKGQIVEISSNLKKLRTEIKLCDGISIRSAQIKDNLKQIKSEKDEEKRKEKKNDEHIRRSSRSGR